jgi:hypothetical protein
LDSDSIADKILKNQHFHKASQEEREEILKGILSKGPAGSLADKMAHAVSDKHETYREVRYCLLMKISRRADSELLCSESTQ